MTSCINHQNPPTRSLCRRKKRKTTFFNRKFNRKWIWLSFIVTTRALVMLNILEAVWSQLKHGVRRKRPPFDSDEKVKKISGKIFEEILKIFFLEIGFSNPKHTQIDCQPKFFKFSLRPLSSTPIHLFRYAWSACIFP